MKYGIELREEWSIQQSDRLAIIDMKKLIGEFGFEWIEYNIGIIKQAKVKQA